MSFNFIKIFIQENIWLCSGFLLAFLIFLGNEWRAKRAAKTITPQQAVLLMNQAALTAIDVRPANAFLAAHISGSKNIPLATLGELTLTQFDRAAPLLLIATAGSQTAEAVAKLTALHFSHLLVLEGGIEGWKAAGFPIHKS